jgi:hypothetical protein
MSIPKGRPENLLCQSPLITKATEDKRHTNENRDCNRSLQDGDSLQNPYKLTVTAVLPPLRSANENHNCKTCFRLLGDRIKVFQNKATLSHQNK